MNEYDFLIVGAGVSGLVLAERISSILKKTVLIVEKRNHIGGNCYDFINSDGILVQKYGPHIFHTNLELVWKYITKFTKFNNYKHKVVAFYQGKYYPIPINLTTVNMFYNLEINSEEELKRFLDEKKVKLTNIENSRDVVISKFGEELYNTFVKYYTKKQWDKYPEELKKEVLERLPIKYNNDPYFFADKYQGMPKRGFTKMFKKMIDNKKIKLMLNTEFSEIKDKIKYKKIIFTGQIDEFFNYKFGKLEFRGIKFKLEKLNKKSFQPNSVVNYPEKEIKFSRIAEFKKFYNHISKKTIICKEFFCWGGIPCYPVMDEKNLDLLSKYTKESEKLLNIYFAGRMGKYKYLNIDQAIEGALNLFEKIKNNA